MSKGLNKVILIGNVGAEPDCKDLGNGNMIAKLPLATNKQWKSKDGEKKEEVTWHSVVAFGRLAEIISSYVHKGGRLYVEGEIRTRKYEKDGREQYWTDIAADNILLLDAKEGSSAGRDAPPEDAIPF